MKNINLWDSDFKRKYTWTNDVLEFIWLINNGDIPINFNIKDGFKVGDSETNIIEQKASKRGINLTYVDDMHNVAICLDGFLSTYISTSFYEKNKELINSAIKNRIINSVNSSLEIRNEFFDDELLEGILKNENLTKLWLYDVKLTDKQIEKIKHKYIDVYIQNKDKTIKLTSKELIDNYLINDLRTNRTFYIPCSITDSQIEYLNEIKNGSILIITDQQINGFRFVNEEKQYEQINKLILKLNNLKKQFIIKIEVNNRTKFNASAEFLNSHNNQSIVIKNDFYDYSITEYLKEEKKLDELVKNVKNSNLSNFEKYIAVYDIVKKYKPYKENKNDLNQSRQLKNILNNDYMVCVGYSKLLRVLLERVGICNKEYNVGVLEVDYKINDTNYLGSHVRNVISIDDDKYDIHGYYLCDATWDNGVNNNYLTYACCTYDEMSRTKEMFSGSKNDYFLSIHNFDEFIKNINSLYNYEIHNNIFNNNPTEIYGQVCSYLIELFKDLDPKKYNLFVQKIILNDSYDNYISLLTIVGQYLETRNNKKVNFEKVLEAEINIQKKLYGLKDEDVLKYKEKLHKENMERYNKLFPYELLSDNKWELKGEKRNK